MEKILLNVDSKFRNKLLYPSPASFSIQAENVFKNVVSIALVSMEFKNTHYIISQFRQNNSFLCNGSKVILDDGNYTLQYILYLLGLQLKTIDNAFQLTFHDSTGRLTISSTNPFTIDFRGKSPYGCLGEYLGFRNEIYENRSQIYSSKTVDISGEDYFFLRINDYGNIRMNLVDNSLAFAKIVLDKDKYSTIYHNNSDTIYKNHEFRQPTDISRLTFELIDYLGNPLPLSIYDQDFSLTLELSYVYNARLKHTLEKNIF